MTRQFPTLQTFRSVVSFSNIMEKMDEWIFTKFSEYVAYYRRYNMHIIAIQDFSLFSVFLATLRKKRVNRFSWKFMSEWHREWLAWLLQDWLDCSILPKLGMADVCIPGVLLVCVQCFRFLPYSKSSVIVTAVIIYSCLISTAHHACLCFDVTEQDASCPQKAVL